MKYELSRSTRLLQPNNVTFSTKSDNVTSLQYNLLVLFVEQLQRYMTTVAYPGMESLIVPVLTVKADEVCSIKHKDLVLDAARRMKDIVFTFDRMDWAIGRRLEGSGPLVTWVDDVKGTDEIKVKLNDMLIPAMTYCGEGVGGTYFLKEQTLADAGRYNKQIRQMILAWRNLGQTVESTDRVRAMLGLGAKVSNKHLKSNILEPAREYILKNSSDVWFEYKFICRNPVPGKKHLADSIMFTIYSADDATLERRETFAEYMAVRTCLVRLLGETASGKVLRYTDKVKETGKLGLIASKDRYYLSRLSSGELDRDHADNCMRKILAEECGIIILKK